MKGKTARSYTTDIQSAMHVLSVLNYIIIQISYTVRIPIFRLVDLYHVALGYDETTSFSDVIIVV